MAFTTLNYDVKDKIAYVTFATPERLNSISEQRLNDLAGVMDLLEADEELHGVAITGEGRAFCVGLDLDLLKRAFEDMTYFEQTVRRLNDIILRLESLPIPVVAVVNGYARAGGFEIALGCDLMLIADEAKIGDNHTHVGVMPGGGSTQRLPRRIGAQRAKELIWSARWLTGPEAAACGLALKSVPLAGLYEELETLLDQFRNKPRAVLSIVKQTIDSGESLGIKDGIDLEIANFIAYMGNEPYAKDMFWASVKDS